MPVLTRDKLPEWRRKTRVVDAPELGEDAQVIVAEMSGLGWAEYVSKVREFDRIPADERTETQSLGLMAFVIDRAVVGEDHKPFFPHGYMACAEGLGPVAMTQLTERLFSAAIELSNASAEGNEKEAASSRPTVASRAA